MTRVARKLTGISALALAVAAALVPLAASWEDALVNRGRDGVAVRGYDPVAYFDGAPAPGSRTIEYTIDGTTYRFASTGNRDRFAKDPARYLPQYGGFCAYAVSRGYTATIDPLAWKIVDGKLYLNYSKRVQKLWEEDVPGNIAKGDANWPSIAAKR
jgi:YHS domain-containing protein